jgi:hypothetical protein
MPRHEKTLRQVSRGFVISAGSQVVLKVSKALPDGVAYRKPGSVGVVVESPPNSAGPYVVQFTDGQTVKAYADELTLRREEVDNELAQTSEDLRPYVIYVCQVGSKAYGLATEESDDDLRGIYLSPARLHWSLYGLPEQLEAVDADKDEVYWELEKFLRLALKANPNVLDTLWTPMVIKADESAEELRTIRRAFLSKHLYKTYSGYVLSQFRRMANAVKHKGTYKPKHAMHLVRLLYSGTAALRTGEIRVDVADHRDELLRIRRGEFSFDEVKQKALDLDKEFQRALDETALPEQPDYARVDDFPVRARRRMVDA